MRWRRTTRSRNAASSGVPIATRWSSRSRSWCCAPASRQVRPSPANCSSSCGRSWPTTNVRDGWSSCPNCRERPRASCSVSGCANRRPRQGRRRHCAEPGVFRLMSIIALSLALAVLVPAAQDPKGAPTPLLKTYWRVTELEEKPVPAAARAHEAHIVFGPTGHVSGSDGCGRLTGTYQFAAPIIKIGAVAATPAGCTSGDAVARTMRSALGRAHVVHQNGSTLVLLDGNGTRVARFEAGPQSVGAAAAGALYGSWQLVKFQGGGKIVAPDDPAKYLVAFLADGGVNARFDCNRARGTWKSSGPNQVQFGSLTLTRSKCAAGSLHDKIVTDWGKIRAYRRDKNHLFLSLMRDGGSYEFAPVPAAKGAR